MPVDQSLVGASFGPTEPHTVTEEGVAEFAAAVGTSYAAGDQLPPTYPIVLAFSAIQAFLADRELDLSRIVHGDQRFEYARPLAPGDVLTATLAVTGVRQIRGTDIITTASEITDDEGGLVCTAGATLVHRAGEAT